jgi:hypothetical protein
LRHGVGCRTKDYIFSGLEEGPCLLCYDGCLAFYLGKVRAAVHCVGHTIT